MFWSWELRNTNEAMSMWLKNENSQAKESGTFVWMLVTVWFCDCRERKEKLVGGPTHCT